MISDVVIGVIQGKWRIVIHYPAIFIKDKRRMRRDDVGINKVIPFQRRDVLQFSKGEEYMPAMRIIRHSDQGFV